MYEINFFKKTGGTGRIYVWAADLEKARLHIEEHGHDITKMPCHKIVHLGMSQVPEGRRIFQELTVYENLLMGAYSVGKKANFRMIYRANSLKF